MEQLLVVKLKSRVTDIITDDKRRPTWLYTCSEHGTKFGQNSSCRKLLWIATLTLTLIQKINVLMHVHTLIQNLAKLFLLGFRILNSILRWAKLKCILIYFLYILPPLFAILFWNKKYNMSICFTKM
jgi:hypothetical protein